jgi:hypothetical protein
LTERVASLSRKGDPDRRSRTDACPSSIDDVDRTTPAVNAGSTDDEISAFIAIEILERDGRTEPITVLVLLTQRRSRDLPSANLVDVDTSPAWHPYRELWNKPILADVLSRAR